MADQPTSILLHTDAGGTYLIYAVYSRHQVLLASVSRHIERELVRKIAQVFAVSYGMVEVRED